MSQPLCRQCHQRSVPRSGMKCSACRKHRGGGSHGAPARCGARGHAADVLTRGSQIVAHPHEHRDFWVTFDVLPIVRQVAPTAPDAAQFRAASDVADLLNAVGARRA